MTLADAEPKRDSNVSWAGWAVFLGVSWTWCIGMFLPHLLVRDYGVPGWIVFAIPNVIGAAAMGWVVRSAESSALLVKQHLLACQLFSAVTIAFHLFFVVAVIGFLLGSMDAALIATVGGAVVLYIIFTHNCRADLVAAFVVLAISLAALFIAAGQLGRNRIALPTFWPDSTLPASDVLWLGVVCLLGFATCPYLDLTFHRARQTSRRPRCAFGAGFGIVFFTMIVFTLLYSQALSERIPKVLAITIGIHMAAQSAFTMAAHARELRQQSSLALTTIVVLTLGSWAAIWYVRRGAFVDGLDPSELVYRVFMGFYGLVFPAYVWIVMLPGRDRFRALVAFAAVVVAAIPLFWMGFVERRMVWLLPGVTIVLAARWLVPSNKGIEAS